MNNHIVFLLEQLEGHSISSTKFFLDIISDFDKRLTALEQLSIDKIPDSEQIADALIAIGDIKVNNIDDLDNSKIEDIYEGKTIQHNLPAL